jgi:hypothetical protein
MDSYPNKIVVYFRDFPLAFHENAQKAAEAAECAGEQGKYWEMHDKLFANQQSLDVASLTKYASDLELDTVAFNTCLDSGAMSAEVQKDIADGKAAGVEGTPTAFINGEILVGAQPFESFKKIIDAELSASAPEPGVLVGMKSTGFSAVRIDDFLVDTQGLLVIKLTNQFGRAITVQSIQASEATGPSGSTIYTFTKANGECEASGCTLEPNEQLKATLGLSVWPAETPYTTNIQITYTDKSTMITHTDYGTISGQVEPI